MFGMDKLLQYRAWVITLRIFKCKNMSKGMFAACVSYDIIICPKNYRVLKKSCRKIIANFFKNMGASNFLRLLGAPQMWSIW